MEFVLKLAIQVCCSCHSLVMDTPTWALGNTGLEQLPRQNHLANPTKSTSGGVHNSPQNFLTSSQPVKLQYVCLDS